ncbi:MAG: hypothetical protein EOP88_02645 [Verrucomicrobiaceae bacterium]|nr:MAG: hypothetical protein EOP88_02645 [Verrucomicrobiaceae bacterium]
MNSSSDIGPSPSPASTGAPVPDAGFQRPANWREALMALVDSRVSLIQLESKELGKEVARRSIFIGAACVSAVITWGLLLIGLISLIAELGGWPWNRVALAAAALHLLLAFVFFRLSKSSGGSAFPITRNEFQKDRAWIENFHHPRKSGD